MKVLPGRQMGSMTSKDHLDFLMVDIESGLFDIEVKIARFTEMVLSAIEGKSIELNMKIPLYAEEKYTTAELIRVFLDAESESIMVSLSGRNAPLEWCLLDIGTQHTLSIEIHARLVSARIFDSLSGQDNLQ